MTAATIHRVEITGDAGLRAAQDIAGLLRQALAAHDTVSIAIDAITAADITTIQTLLAARKQAQASAKSLSLAAPPVGALRTLLIATGCLDAQGRPLTPDGDFWLSQTRQGEGAAA